MANADLAADTAVSRLKAAPGWYTANLPDHWNYRTPSGGVLMTVALRAMQTELADPKLTPVSATTVFCSPVPSGPLEIRVEILRHGSAAAQVRSALSSTKLPGPGLEVTAIFAREREGPEFLDAAPPQVPAPADAPEFGDPSRGSGSPPWSFFDNVDTRLALGDKWWVPGWSAGDARFARWFRYQVPQRLDDGTVDPFALPPIADTMPPALIRKLGPGRPRFYAPSLDLTVHFLDRTRSEWLLVHTHCRRARAGYATADVEIWDEHKTLVAYATQTMMLRRRAAM